MVNFENGVLTAQLFGNYGMFEIYVSILSGIYLFVASAIAIIVISLNFGRDIDRVHLIGSSIGPGGVKLAERGTPGWQAISTAILYTGLIGLGVVMEHVVEGSILLNFFHYLTMVSPPVALYFYYVGIKRHVSREIETVILLRVVLGTALLFVAVGLLAGLSEAYAGIIEKFFLYFTFIPVLVFSGYVVMSAIRVYEKYLLFIPTVSAMVISTALLALVTLAGQLSVVFGYAEVYILTQGVRDILICVTATSILAYGGAMRMIRKQRI